MVSVIITNRNEPYLAETVASVRKACRRGKPDIIIVNDGVQTDFTAPWDTRVFQPWDVARGCMAARDFGIANAKEKATVTIDAHMDFELGFFGAVRDHLKKNPTHVTCGLCPGLNPETWVADSAVRGGAYMLWPKDDVTIRVRWCYEGGEGERPAVLGASYGIDRDWYMDGLLRPWSFGTGWGTDEELISVVNWICGGANWLIPKNASHWFRDAKTIPYPQSGPTIYQIWANRVRMVNMLPVSATERSWLIQRIYSHEAVRAIAAKMTPYLAVSDVTAYREWLGQHERTFAQYRDAWMSERDPNEYPEFRPKAMCPAPPAPEPPGDVPTVLEPATRQPNIVVMDKGIPCPHCGHRYGHRVTHTYPNGNRRRLCGAVDNSGCAMPFVTVRAKEDDG